jgi:hypothetical protein
MQWLGLFDLLARANKQLLISSSTETRADRLQQLTMHWLSCMTPCVV